MAVSVDPALVCGDMEHRQGAPLLAREQFPVDAEGAEKLFRAILEVAESLPQLHTTAQLVRDKLIRGDIRPEELFRAYMLENAEPFTLDDSSNSFDGPIKYSEVWNRPAFKLVASGFDDKTVSEYYVRDAFFQRTDNMVFDRKKGRRDIDLFVGRAPTLIPILEDSFLTRLSDKTYGIVVQGSHFTTHPQAMDNMAFNAPDPTAPFGGLLRGFNRTNVKNRRGDALVSAEGLVIRGSYVDWRNDRIVIPRAGLASYTSAQQAATCALCAAKVSTCSAGKPGLPPSSPPPSCARTLTLTSGSCSPKARCIPFTGRTCRWAKTTRCCASPIASSLTIAPWGW